LPYLVLLTLATVEWHV